MFQGSNKKVGVWKKTLLFPSDVSILIRDLSDNLSRRSISESFLYLCRSVTMLSRIARPLARAGSSLSRARSTQATAKIQQGDSSKVVFEKEDKYGAHNYHPMPVAINKGKGDISQNIVFYW